MSAEAQTAHSRSPRHATVPVLRVLRNRRWVWLTGAVVILAAGAGAIGKHAMSQPRFCGTCHVVRPYVESSHHSLHRDVACLECHSRPSVRHSLRRVSGMRRIRGTMPAAEHPVPDAVCTRCHNEQSDLPVMDPCVLQADGEPPPCTKCHKDIAHWSRE